MTKSASRYLSAALFAASMCFAQAAPGQQSANVVMPLMLDQSVDIPLSTFSVHQRAFTCAEGDALPTLGIDYADGQKLMDFNEVSTGVAFVLHDPVKSVRYFVKDNKYGWTINASGPALQAEGIEPGTPVDIVMTIWRDGGADWTVTTGKFTQSSAGCMNIPPRPRVLEPQ